MGSRDSLSLHQNSRRDHRQDRQAPSSGVKTLREAVVSSSTLDESVAMLAEPTEVVNVRASTDFSDDVTVCGELVSAQTEWVRKVTPLEFSVTDDDQTREIERPVTPLMIPDRGRELADLQQQLGAKDELISALVGELEQVVEQLDRMQRTGNNRTQVASSGVAALPAEVVEEQQQVLGDLQRVVQQWEALQASSVLGRIEAEVSELKSMMACRVGFSAPGESPSHVGQVSDNRLDDTALRSGIGHHERGPSSAAPEDASWETIKRRMMSGDKPTEMIVPPTVDEEQVSLDGVVAPHPVDLDGATRYELQQACTERDAYIVQLTRMLRSRHAVSLPDNWDDIVEVPEEQKARVDQLATRLEEQVRLAEVEMSLERARLSRERTQLQAEREKIDKHLKRLGLTSLDELETIAVENGSTSDRRWMRFLGVNRRS